MYILKNTYLVESKLKCEPLHVLVPEFSRIYFTVDFKSQETRCVRIFLYNTVQVVLKRGWFLNPDTLALQNLT